jgi:hypothetical protein
MAWKAAGHRRANGKHNSGGSPIHKGAAHQVARGLLCATKINNSVPPSNEGPPEDFADGSYWPRLCENAKAINRDRTTFRLRPL